MIRKSRTPKGIHERSRVPSLVFFGIRYDVQPPNALALEARSHPLQQLARTPGLDAYWVNLEALEERYGLFVGKRRGLFGPEDATELQWSSAEICDVVERMTSTLRAAGLAGAPALHRCEIPDA